LCFVVDTKQDFGGIINAVNRVDGVDDVEVFDIYA
jgi:phenylalanyl-tRNA synthetase beta subunit